jgi:hypothetical protein
MTLVLTLTHQSRRVDEGAFVWDLGSGIPSTVMDKDRKVDISNKNSCLLFASEEEVLKQHL